MSYLPMMLSVPDVGEVKLQEIAESVNKIKRSILFASPSWLMARLRLFRRR